MASSAPWGPSSSLSHSRVRGWLMFHGSLEIVYIELQLTYIYMCYGGGTHARTHTHTHTHTHTGVYIAHPPAVPEVVEAAIKVRPSPLQFI